MTHDVISQASTVARSCPLTLNVSCTVSATPLRKYWRLLTNVPGPIPRSVDEMSENNHNAVVTQMDLPTDATSSRSSGTSRLAVPLVLVLRRECLPGFVKKIVVGAVSCTIFLPEKLPVEIFKLCEFFTLISCCASLRPDDRAKHHTGDCHVFLLLNIHPYVQK